jgi:hypothetical protein
MGRSAPVIASLEIERSMSWSAWLPPYQNENFFASTAGGPRLLGGLVRGAISESAGAHPNRPVT